MDSRKTISKKAVPRHRRMGPDAPTLRAEAQRLNSTIRVGFDQRVRDVPPLLTRPPVAGMSPTVAWILLISLAGVLILPLTAPSRELYALRDLAHLPLGAVVTIALARLFRGASGVGGLFLTFAVSILLLIGFEALQPLVGRQGSVSNAVTGACGATAATLVIGARSSVPLVALIARAAALFFVALGVRPAVLDLMDAAHQRRALPKLAAFDDELELRRWSFVDATGTRVRKEVGTDDWWLRVELEPGLRPAAVLEWPGADWRSWNTLAFDIHVDGAGSLPLVLELRDKDDDGCAGGRCRERLVLEAGHQEIKISLSKLASAPSARRLDLEWIRRVAWIAEDSPQARTIHIDNVRLIRDVP